LTYSLKCTIINTIRHGKAAAQEAEVDGLGREEGLLAESSSQVASTEGRLGVGGLKGCGLVGPHG